MRVKEAIEHLKAKDPEETICMVIWLKEDVQSQGEGVSDEEAVNILDAMENDHDASLGITWDTIEAYL